MFSTSNRNKLLGLLLGVAAALIGGSWQVLTRLATTSATAKLEPIDLALLRYAIPALLLLPLLRRGGLWPHEVRKPALLFVLVGAGLPFGLVAMSGTRFAPAAHMGVLMAGASPLIAALLAWAIWRERPSGWRALGLAMMAIGVCLLSAHSISTFDMSAVGTWRGDALFLLAALLWAGYTLAFRRSGLTPWHGAALVSAWSALLVLPLWLWRALHEGSSLSQVAPQTLLFNAVFQGVVAGLFGLWTISEAIKRLGSAQAAAFGALAPVASALGGWWLLGDRLAALDGLAVTCAVIGVLMASGALSAHPQPQRR
jgi:drug/metabolite transporter (DMT)-like permease